MLREFLSVEEQEILLHSQSAKLAGPDVLRENWYLAWEQSQACATDFAFGQLLQWNFVQVLGSNRGSL